MLLMADSAPPETAFSDSSPNTRTRFLLPCSISSVISISPFNIDIDNKQVTVKIINKDLQEVAGTFADNLKKDYSTFQLLAKLSDDNFLDRKLSELCEEIGRASWRERV